MKMLIKGPPKVELNSRSAPGPIPAKKGMYSMRTITSTPPIISRALRHQQPKNPFQPGW